MQILENDFSIHVEPLEVTLIGPTTTANGEFVLNVDGSVTYTPNSDFIGIDSIQYLACDTVETVPACAVATIYIEVDVFDENGCFPNETYTFLSKGYADDFVDNGNVTDADLALGMPNLDGARLDADADPAARGVLRLDLLEIIEENDTLFLHLASGSSLTATVLVETSSDDITYGAAETMLCMFLTC